MFGMFKKVKCSLCGKKHVDKNFFIHIFRHSYICRNCYSMIKDDLEQNFNKYSAMKNIIDEQNLWHIYSDHDNYWKNKKFILTNVKNCNISSLDLEYSIIDINNGKILYTTTLNKNISRITNRRII